MNILVANHWLEKLGGSETFTYTLTGELVRQGHNVDLFTFRHGMVSERIRKDFGVGENLRNKYDLILANHYTCVEKLHSLGFTIQTCHGIFPKLEQPSPKADRYVAISAEVSEHLQKAGFKSTIILNGIDCKRFSPVKMVNIQPERLLSLVHSDEANKVVEKACKISGVKFMAANKYKNPVWDVENLINEADVVVSLGRGAYESMACGRSVVVFDNRKYFNSCGDGYLYYLGNLAKSIENNCSGRALNIPFNASGLANQILLHNICNADHLRYFANTYLNIELQVLKYISLYESTIK
jgi:hypothetical protein